MARRNSDWPQVNPVIVRWIDSTGTSGWGAKPGAQLECITIGNLIKRDKDRVAITMNKSHYSDGELMEIPAAVVKSVRRLKE